MSSNCGGAPFSPGCLKHNFSRSGDSVDGVSFSSCRKDIRWCPKFSWWYTLLPSSKCLLAKIFGRPYGCGVMDDGRWMVQGVGKVKS